MYKESRMNNKNKEFFFDGDENEVAVITFTDSDGITVQAEVIANVEIEEFNKEYIATLPIKEVGKYKAERFNWHTVDARVRASGKGLVLALGHHLA